MSYDNPRIKSLSMSSLDVMMALSDGNPGAISVLAKLIQHTKKIDQDSVIGWLGPISSLDNLDCYGSRIWLLYKDVCGGNLVGLLAVLRANQLGFIEDREINSAIDGGKPLQISSIVEQVKARLKGFDATSCAAAE